MEPTTVDRTGSRWTRLASLGSLLGVIGAALIFVGALQTTEAGGGNLPCPDGEYLVAQFEYNGGSYDLSSGTEGVVTVDGDADGGTWTSTLPISTVIVKGGPAAVVTTYEPPATDGTFTNEGLPPVGSGNIPDISNVRFCTPDDETTTTTEGETTTTEATTSTTEATTSTTDGTTSTSEATTSTTEATTSTTDATTSTSEATTSTTDATTSTSDGTTSTSEATTTTEGAEVAGVTVTSVVPDTSDELPRTGSPSIPLIALGALLVVSGITLVIVGRGGTRRAT